MISYPGEQEKNYWNKIFADREKKLNNKSHIKKKGSQKVCVLKLVCQFLSTLQSSAYWKSYHGSRGVFPAWVPLKALLWNTAGKYHWRPS